MKLWSPTLDDRVLHADDPDRDERTLEVFRFSTRAATLPRVIAGLSMLVELAWTKTALVTVLTLSSGFR
jgi:hypothetical protein